MAQSLTSVLVSPCEPCLIDLVDHVLLVAFLPSPDSYGLCFFFYAKFPDFRVEGKDENPLFRLCPHNVLLWDSVPASISFWRKAIWQWLNKNQAPNYEYSKMPLEIISLCLFVFVLFCFCQSFWFYSRTLLCSGHSSTVWHGLPLVAWASSRTKHLLATPRNSVPPLPQHIL